jgi:uncharacterized membrane protein
VRPLLLALVVLSIVGAGIAGYLTYTHYNEGALVCTVGSCETVQQSKYAKVGPLPVAILGLAMYLVLGSLALLRYLGRGPLSFELTTTGAWAITLAGVAYAAYLTYVELWVIDAVCQWCVASAIVTTIMLVVESVVLWRGVLSDAADFD